VPKLLAMSTFPNITLRHFLSIAQQSLVCQGLLIIEASRSNSGTPHSIGLFWTSDQPDADNSASQHITTHRRQTSMLLAGLEPPFPETDRPQTHVLEHGYWDRLKLHIPTRIYTFVQHCGISFHWRVRLCMSCYWVHITCL
jgi:hypothetical protein